MKKFLATIAVVVPALLIGSGAVFAANYNHGSSADETSIAKVAAEPQTLDVSNQTFAKDETVYLITDQSGKVNQTFVGSNLIDSDEALPVEMKITYYLDGDEISVSELAGKSGHVKIKYDFTSSKYCQGKLVPFLAVTGMDLDNHIFKNLKLDNGKIIKESSENTLVAGYSFIGLNEDLNTDFLPSGFTIEADVDSFKFGTTYTLVTNELFADLDTSKLNTIDEIVGQMNQLSSGLDEIIDGSSSLANGLDSALLGAKKLQTGAGELSTGANQLASGAGALSSGLQELNTGATKLSDGLDSVVTINDQIMTKIDSVSATIQAKAADITSIVAKIAETNPELASELTVAISELSGYYDQAYSAVNEYVSGIRQLADGADELEKGAETLASGADTLASGARTLADGMDELNSGATSLTSGLEQLSTGSKTLDDGLKAFREQGINKLVNFANHDLSSFAKNLRLTIEAARSYRAYNSPSANSVKFIFKTPSVSKEK